MFFKNTTNTVLVRLQQYSSSSQRLGTETHLVTNTRSLTVYVFTLAFAIAVLPSFLLMSLSSAVILD